MCVRAHQNSMAMYETFNPPHSTFSFTAAYLNGLKTDNGVNTDLYNVTSALHFIGGQDALDRATRERARFILTSWRIPQLGTKTELATNREIQT